MVLRRYQNGNCTVTLHHDGTKEREWDGEPRPILPESVDLKITNACDQGCPWCHEQSVPGGTHTFIDAISQPLRGALAGMEVAVGGGDAMAHPDLRLILQRMRRAGLIPNITVNSKQIGGHADTLHRIRQEGLVFGVGFTWSPDDYYALLDAWDDNSVLHVIAGLHDITGLLGDLRGSPFKKVLVLGFKRYGRGASYPEDVESRLGEWRFWMPRLLTRPDTIVSFDNLALGQLGIQEIVSPEVWKKHYMGDDGTHTMYIDAVTGTFAATSTSERHPIGSLGLREMFAVVRSESLCGPKTKPT